MPVAYESAVADFEWNIPAGYNLPAGIESHAETFGDRIALEFRAASGFETTRTYGEVRDDMNRFAEALAELGVEQGDRVMHLIPGTPMRSRYNWVR